MKLGFLRNILLIGTVVLLASCSNSVYMDYPELTASNPAILEQNKLNRDEADKRLKVLKELAKEPYPEYRINSGDIFSVKVYNHPDLDLQTPITPDGYIAMMFVGQVKVSGLTLPEASRKIENALADYIKNPVVSVIPSTINSQNVTIAGGVPRPGMYSVSNGMRLSDLFAVAGGSASRMFDGQVVEVADFKNSLLIRDGKMIDVDFSAAIEHGNFWNNIKLHRGDYVYIGVRSETMVTLLGEVNREYRKIWNSTTGLLELIADGGGLKESHWQYAVIIRGKMSSPTFFRVDLDGVLHGKKANVMLDPGDTVFIPKDGMSQYNMFIRKLMPTGELINMVLTPAFFWTSFR